MARAAAAGGRGLMLRGPLHTSGPDGRCEECGEPFPCSVIVRQRHLNNQIVPTPALHSRDLEHQLRTLHHALQAFEQELRDQPHQGAPRSQRAKLIAAAVEHIDMALRAPEQAGHDESEASPT